MGLLHERYDPLFGASGVDFLERMQVFEVFSSQTSFVLRTMTLTKVQGAAAGELDRRRAEHRELGAAAMAMAWAQSLYGIVQNAIRRMKSACERTGAQIKASTAQTMPRR